MGGYLLTGRAQRLYIPPSLHSVFTNNMLQFIAQIVTIWVDATKGNVPLLSCLLGCSDSLSTVGWLFRTNFDPTYKSTHEHCSRHLARILIKHKITLYSQHQRGKHDLFVDILSRWYFLTAVKFTILLRSKFSKQLPAHFKISPLPKEIILWITCTLQKLQKQT